MFSLEGLEPGPIEPGTLPLKPPLFDGPVFEPLVEPLANAVNGGESKLSAHQATMSYNLPTDIDTFFALTAGVAENAHYNQVQAGDGPSIAPIVDAGGGVDAYRTNVLPYLPPPSTSVPSKLIEPPKPDPAIYEPGPLPEPTDTQQV